MIIDNHGVTVDDATALRTLVVAEPGSSDRAGAGDRLGRLLAVIGDLTNAVLTVEQGWPYIGEGVNPGAALTGALVDVLRAAGGIAVHYQLLVRLPASKGYLPSPNSHVQLALLVQAAGALAQAIDIAEGPASRSATSFGSTWATTFSCLDGRSPNGAAPERPAEVPRKPLSKRVGAELAGAVDLVIVRALLLAEHYGLRHELRRVIELRYRALQNEEGLR